MGAGCVPRIYQNTHTYIQTHTLSPLDIPFRQPPPYLLKCPRFYQHTHTLLCSPYMWYVCVCMCMFMSFISHFPPSLLPTADKPSLITSSSCLYVCVCVCLCMCRLPPIHRRRALQVPEGAKVCLCACVSVGGGVQVYVIDGVREGGIGWGGEGLGDAVCVCVCVCMGVGWVMICGWMCVCVCAYLDDDDDGGKKGQGRERRKMERRRSWEWRRMEGRCMGSWWMVGLGLCSCVCVHM